MNLTIIEQPPFEPVSLSDVYAHLRLNATGSPPSHPDDAMLTRHIKTSRIYAENMQQRSYVQRTMRLSFSSADIGGGVRSSSRSYGLYNYPQGTSAADTLGTLSCGRNWIELPRPPLGWVVSVSYYDADNTLQTVDESEYFDTDDIVPRLQFVSGFSLPAMSQRGDAIRVDYIAGYLPTSSPADTQQACAENVPENVKDAILLGVQLLCDQPTDAAESISASRDSLLNDGTNIITMA